MPQLVESKVKQLSAPPVIDVMRLQEQSPLSTVMKY